MISLQVLAAALMTGCPGWAYGPSDPPGDWSTESLRRIVWNLGGWTAPDGTAGAGGGRARSAWAADPEGGGDLGLAMVFDGPLAAWPESLAARCRPAEGAPPADITDARPFGGPNLAGIGPELLEPCLGRLAALLAEGPYLAPFTLTEVEPGLSMATAEARFGPRLGSREVVVFRISRDRFRLVPHHEDESERWRDSPASIGGWSERLPGAVLLANAGQYYSDRSHMGLLRRGGADLSGRLHRHWKGFLVQDRLPEPAGQTAGPDVSGPAGQTAGPDVSGPAALPDGGPDPAGRPDAGPDPAATRAAPPPASDWAIIDEDTRPPGAPGHELYATVVQSHMVIDRLGRVRVRSTERLASRSAIGVDAFGDLWLVGVMGAISLEDLAALLEGLDLVSAIGLDGGLESQLALRSGGRTSLWLGRHTNNFLGDFMAAGPAPTLPAVIAFERIGPGSE
jgi:hypothetical protein